MSAEWYLLYSGTSPDGQGFPKYTGRTIDKEWAIVHFKKCKKNIYSIGKVEIVTDTEIRVMTVADL